MTQAVRDERGRFLVGNKCSPGRRPREIERSYVEVLWSECSVEDWTEIVQVAVADAKRGDSVARKWLGDRLLGRPRQEVLVEHSESVYDVHHRVNQARSGLIELAQTLRDRAEGLAAHKGNGQAVVAEGTEGHRLACQSGVSSFDSFE